jgi:hypothetical protein
MTGSGGRGFRRKRHDGWDDFGASPGKRAGLFSSGASGRRPDQLRVVPGRRDLMDGSGAGDHARLTPSPI